MPEADVALTRRDLEDLRKDLRLDLAELKSDLRLEIAGLRAETQSGRVDLLKWGGGILVTGLLLQTGLVLGGVYFLLAHFKP